MKLYKVGFDTFAKGVSEKRSMVSLIRGTDSYSVLKDLFRRNPFTDGVEITKIEIEEHK